MNVMYICADGPGDSDESLEADLRSAVAHLADSTVVEVHPGTNEIPLELQLEIASASPSQIDRFSDAIASLCRSTNRTFTISLRLDDRTRTRLPGYSPDLFVQDEHVIGVRADRAASLHDYLTFLLGSA